MADLDLTSGDPARADEDTPAGRRRRKRADSTAGTARAEKNSEGEIRAGLTRAFEGLAKARYVRDDDELGDAISEEADAMTGGIVTLTDSVPVLRTPIIVALHLIITLLAFGRVAGILLGRAQERRRAAQEAAEADSNSSFITEVQ